MRVDEYGSGVFQTIDASESVVSTTAFELKHFYRNCVFYGTYFNKNFYLDRNNPLKHEFGFFVSFEQNHATLRVLTKNGALEYSSRRRDESCVIL